MRYASNHKAHTRQNILRSASKLFAAKGFAAVSIDDIMRECQLTHGGFYSHFKSKSELYRHALELIEPIRDNAISLESILQSLLQDAEGGARKELPFAFFATDVACNDPQVRTAYAEALATLSARIAAMTNSERASAALSTTAMMIGAMVMAKTVDDESVRIKLKSACTEAANSLLTNASAPLSFFWEAPERNYAKCLSG